jgi:hypothetical protein
MRAVNDTIDASGDIFPVLPRLTLPAKAEKVARLSCGEVER